VLVFANTEHAVSELCSVCIDACCFIQSKPPQDVTSTSIFAELAARHNVSPPLFGGDLEGKALAQVVHQQPEACTSNRTLAAQQQRQTRLLSCSFAQASTGRPSEVYQSRYSLAPGTLGWRCLGPLICFPLNGGGGNYSLPPRASTPTGRDGTTTAPLAGPATSLPPSHREVQLK
jgi:hypothetical protein